MTDQESTITSQLHAEQYRPLHILSIVTSPYHLQTDGLVEHFNQTLKAMLSRFADSEGKDWDKIICSITRRCCKLRQDICFLSCCLVGA